MFCVSRTNEYKKSFLFWFVLFIIIFATKQSIGQAVKDSLLSNKLKTDSLSKKGKVHSPILATILSTTCPGIGQIYNRKYWKLPIVWGGIGAFGYLFLQENSRYNQYKTALSLRLDGDATTIDNYVDKYSDANLRLVKENSRSNRDLMLIITSLFYVLNIVDANVDGHLFNFDVSEKLTLGLQPQILPTILYPANGLTITMNLK